MAMIAITDTGCERPTLRLTVTLPGILWVYLRRRRERRLLARLSRLSDRLIRDAGFDPELVRGAAVGTWDRGIPGLSQDRRAR
jgi:hypothetical protein